MVKESFHPNSYLVNIKNMKLGLKARTRLLNVLEKSSGNGKTIAKECGLPYGVAMHHLKLLTTEGIVQRRGKRPYVWVLTGIGQKRLTNSRLE